MVQIRAPGGLVVLGVADLLLPHMVWPLYLQCILGQVVVVARVVMEVEEELQFMREPVVQVVQVVQEVPVEPEEGLYLLKLAVLLIVEQLPQTEVLEVVVAQDQ
jgi:hypothetical protein